MTSPRRSGTSPLVGAALMGAALALAALHRQGVPSAGPSMPLTAFPALQRKGALFSTHRDRPVQGCSWRYWYLQHSKRVWFRVPTHQNIQEMRPVFAYRGRPILHVSELHSFERSPVYGRRPPVLWGDFVGMGWGSGPEGTTLFLELWTRWTWLHPEACGHPEQFRVDFYAPTSADPDQARGPMGNS